MAQKSQEVQESAFGFRRDVHRARIILNRNLSEEELLEQIPLAVKEAFGVRGTHYLIFSPGRDIDSPAQDRLFTCLHRLYVIEPEPDPVAGGQSASLSLANLRSRADQQEEVEWNTH